MLSPAINLNEFTNAVTCDTIHSKKTKEAQVMFRPVYEKQNYYQLRDSRIVDGDGLLVL